MLLTVMLIEKCFVLYFPFKAKSYCTVGTAKLVTCILALTIAGFNSPVFISYKRFGKGCFMTKYVNYIDTLFYVTLPIVFMCLSNTAIIYKLMYIKNKGISHTNESVSKSSTRGSVMVVTVSLAFIILTSPRAMDSAMNYKLSKTPFRLIFIVSMMYLNHSINGILYCIFGEKFRNELRKVMLSCRKKRMSENCSTSMNTVSTNVMMSSME